MYGYVVPIKDKLSQADFCLYRSFYCGICKAIGRNYGQIPRFTTNYDMVFLSVLIFDATKHEVNFENKGCICNPFKKKTTVCGNDLLDKIVAANLILTYYKATDDVIDDGAKKKIARQFLKKSYKKAKSVLPEVDAIAERQYEKLRKLERENTVGVDRVADCFAVMLMQIAGVLLGDNAEDKLLKLCYNVGKFVYIIDALDDVAEDYKKKHYNPLLAETPEFKSRKQYIEDNRENLSFMLNSTANRAIECFNGMVFTGANDLLANVVRFGLRGKIEEIMGSEKKLPKPKI